LIDESEGAIDLVDQTVRIALFRITQEAINNAVRHAHAASLDVRLRASSTAVIIEVSDDGRGLTPGAKGEGGGIDNMMTRARLISAKFTIGANREGEGTTVRVQLPLPTQKMKSRGDGA
jgi:signal transduction histidine kinase